MRSARPTLRNYLFKERATASDVVEAQRRGLKSALGELSATQLLNRPLDDLVAELVEKFRLDVPVLDREHVVEFPPEETDIDVTHDYSRVFMSPGPHYVKGTRLSIGIPFVGDPALFRYPESSFAIPIEGAVDEQGSRLILSHDAERPDAANIRREFDNRINQIAHALDMIRGRTREWNDGLPALVRAPLTQRRDTLEKDGKISLGFAPADPPRLPSDDRSPIGKQGSAVFGEGQQFDALREFQRIIARATQSVILIDPYVDETILDSLSGKRSRVSVRLLTKAVGGPFIAAAKAFNAQHGGLSIRTSTSFHDRFVIVDNKRFYHFGASIKDAGKRVFRLSQIENVPEQTALKDQFDVAWGAGKVEPCG